MFDLIGWPRNSKFLSQTTVLVMGPSCISDALWLCHIDIRQPLGLCKYLGGGRGGCHMDLSLPQQLPKLHLVPLTLHPDPESLL